MAPEIHTFIDRLTVDDYQAIAGPDWPTIDELKSKTNLPEFVINEIAALTREFNKSHEKTNNFCVLPFYGREYPGNVACCLMTNHTTLDRVQSDMLSGIRAPECQQCWELEDVGALSDRIIKNRTIDFYRKTDITRLYDECDENRNTTQSFKIDTSNVCNAACLTCCGMASSLWVNYEHRNGVNKHKVWKIDANDPIFNIDYARAININFRGGEPTLSKENFRILEKLLDHKNLECLISFTTNGSFDLTDYQINLLEKFKNVNFCFSIDGTEKVFEYLRFPLTWDKTLRNIDRCRSYGFTISSSYTLSNVNIYYHDQTVEWFNKHNINYLINPVHSPEYFSPSALSRDIKNLILNNTPDTVLNKYLATHSEKDDFNFENMKLEIAKQDQWKAIRINDYLPEFSELIMIQ